MNQNNDFTQICASSEISVSVASQESKENIVPFVCGSLQLEELPISDWKLYMWVKVLYEGETFLGKIINIEQNEAQVRCLEKPFRVL